MGGTDGGGYSLRQYIQWQEKDYKEGQHTPLTMRVPILVTKPLILSDLSDDRASVEPGSVGASRARHSCSPLLRDARFSCSRFRSHSSSQAYNASTCYSFPKSFDSCEVPGSFLPLRSIARGKLVATL